MKVLARFLLCLALCTVVVDGRVGFFGQVLSESLEELLTALNPETPPVEPQSNAANCPLERLSELTIRVDSRPEDLEWRMVCGDEVLSTSSNLPADAVVEDAICLPADASLCILTITDESRDGLDPGYYRWVVGGEEIGFYFSEWGASSEYSSRTYCYGADCPSCTPIGWELQVDEFPEQVGYSLTCQGEVEDEVIWDAPVGSMMEPYEYVQGQTCVDLDAYCCTLAIDDAGGDGLISPTQGMPGFFTFTVNGTPKAFYDGDTGVPYPQLTYSFGAC